MQRKKKNSFSELIKFEYFFLWRGRKIWGHVIKIKFPILLIFIKRSLCARFSTIVHRHDRDRVFKKWDIPQSTCWQQAHSNKTKTESFLEKRAFCTAWLQCSWVQDARWDLPHTWLWGRTYKQELWAVRPRW